MAICKYCNQDMLTIDDCSANRTIEYPDGERFDAKRFWEEIDLRCPDCNIKHGNYHHPGCTKEKCPRCGGQLISCGCMDEK